MDLRPWLYLSLRPLRAQVYTCTLEPTKRFLREHHFPILTSKSQYQKRRALADPRIRRVRRKRATDVRPVKACHTKVRIKAPVTFPTEWPGKACKETRVTWSQSPCKRRGKILNSRRETTNHGSREEGGPPPVQVPTTRSSKHGN